MGWSSGSSPRSTTPNRSRLAPCAPTTMHLGQGRPQPTPLGCPPLMQSRTSPGPQTLGHHNAVVGCLRRGGLTWPMVAHANAMLDAFIYGFALLETSLPYQADGELVAVVEDITQTLDPDTYPHLVGFTTSTSSSPATTSVTRSSSASTASSKQ